ncbi:hypothetical protein [Stenotrophomonas sp. MMGLT7]|uniref:hypothetical protein n=1 Tax=Stenotrophomonas sp. MMGLT7 TaxID=2901227 RepID=UPI001E36826F|nr:hypothetical protein [Stenotrophomonas sp. MMGLT7]MCD7097186.1 hypothetical protein [Stenotrophomonas sp. MMGLT7]
MTTDMTMPASGNAFVQQKGDSHSPVIQPGEWVEIDPDVTMFNGSGVYLTDWKHFEPRPNYPRRCPQLRRLAYIDGELHSVPYNPVIPSFKVNVDDLLIGGKAVGY